MPLDRRSLILHAMMAGLGGCVGGARLPARADGWEMDRVTQFRSDIETYAAAGIKAAGGPGDRTVDRWLERELQASGYDVAWQSIDVPFFTAQQAILRCADTQATLLPQAIVVPTRAQGVRAPLVCVDRANYAAADVAGALVLVDLPAARWSSIEPLRAILMHLFAHGARALILVTNGPTGGAIALNVDVAAPPFPRPVAILAPRDAAPFLQAAERLGSATLILTGEEGYRRAHSLSARHRRARTGGRTIAVSTPKSGWFDCVGERGGGIALWLALARWVADTDSTRDFRFFANSGHEYGNAGMQHLLRTVAPDVAATQFWLHLGANVAARDWADGPPPLTPLPGADPARTLAVSDALINPARRLFAGQGGLEDPIIADARVAGELHELVLAGYPRVAGIFGAHRFHHLVEDDLRCAAPEALPAIFDALHGLITAAQG